MTQSGIPALPADRQAEPVTTRPETLEQVLSVLSPSTRQSVSRETAAPILIAGGTDVYPARVGQALLAPSVDLSGVADLTGISQVQQGNERFIRIGAMTRWADLRDRRFALLAGPAHDALAMAAAQVGGRQIQSRATLGGNLCHASPAADGLPVLLALNARVILARANGRRVLPVGQFICGPRRTVLRPDELLEAILIPDESSAGRSHSAFLKLGQRRYLIISVAMIAVSLRWSAAASPVLESGAVAVGSCGPTASRLLRLEQQLTGLSPSGLLALAGRALDPGWLEPLSPISDVRATAAYRLAAVETMIRRALAALAQAPGKSMAVVHDE